MHVRIVFNGQRHCYSLRNAKATEPAWVGGLRLAWRRRLQQRKPLPPPAHAAAARLLELRGPTLMARHEALEHARELNELAAQRKWKC